jgi:hypothetical protein
MFFDVYALYVEGEANHQGTKIHGQEGWRPLRTAAEGGGSSSHRAAGGGAWRSYGYPVFPKK